VLNPEAVEGLVTLFTEGADAAQVAGQAYPPEEVAWLCATSYNVALSLVDGASRRPTASALSASLALCRQSIALCTCMAPGPLRTSYDAAVRPFYSRLLLMSTSGRDDGQ
jgi:hypothetical protein